MHRVSISRTLMRLPSPSLVHGLDLAPCKKSEIRSEDSCPAYLTRCRDRKRNLWSINHQEAATCFTLPPNTSLPVPRGHHATAI